MVFLCVGACGIWEASKFGKSAKGILRQICVCIYIYIYVHVYMYICMYICIYAFDSQIHLHHLSWNSNKKRHHPKSIFKQTSIKIQSPPKKIWFHEFFTDPFETTLTTYKGPGWVSLTHAPRPWLKRQPSSGRWNHPPKPSWGHQNLHF